MKFPRIDKVFVLCIFGLNLLGFLSLYGYDTNILIKQVIFSIVGWVIFFLISRIHYKYWTNHAMLIYIIGIISLVLVLFGESIRGIHGWFSLGFINIQPAEFTKIAFVIMLSTYLAYMKRPSFYFIDLVILTIILFIPLLLIFKQPDLGTAVIYIIPFLTLIYIKGMRLSFFLYLCSYLLLTAIFSIFLIYLQQVKYSVFQAISLEKILLPISVLILFLFLIKKLFQLNIKLVYAIVAAGVVLCSYSSAVVFSHLLKPYQKTRLIAFLAPEIDPLGAGYTLMQSKIAIGSGRLLGRGLFHSVQYGGYFVPQVHTDFTFCALAERFGLVGVSIFFLLFMLVVYSGVYIAQIARDSIGSLLCSGLISLFAGEVLLNLCVELGFLPTTGVPLPLISYGGSSLLKTFIGFGIILSIYRNASPRLT